MFGPCLLPGNHAAEAADTDPALAQMLTEDLERQRQTFVAAVTLIAGHEIERQSAEGLWALMNEESYRLLVRSCGWTDQQYEQWLAESITRLLAAEQPPPRGAP